MKKVKILNVELDNVTLDELLAQLDSGIVVTPNVDHIVKMQSDREFYDIVRRAEWVICDSKILWLCSKFTGYPLSCAIPGSSLFPAFYEHHRNDADCRIFLLGGLDGVADEARRRINEKVGREMVVGAYSPSYGFEKKQEENEDIYRRINESGANVVLVGVGCPKQEKWIDKHRLQMPGVKLWLPLGATIDFEAGRYRRAPLFVQRMGMEWFYRFLQEPRRMFRRYFVDDMRFFYYFARQLAGRYRNPF